MVHPVPQKGETKISCYVGENWIKQAEIFVYLGRFYH